MKRKQTLRDEIAVFGLSDGAGGAGRQDDIEDDDLGHEYDANIWHFSPADVTVQRHVYPEASLLGLPTELRLQILQYILPNQREIKLRTPSKRERPERIIAKFINGGRGIWDRVPIKKREQLLLEWKEHIERNYDALRQDLEPCSPAILTVNRQLYSEASQIAYKDKQFHAKLERDSFYLCSREFLVRSQIRGYNMIESQLRHVGGLRIHVDVSERFCPEEHNLGHECDTMGCFRRRKDGIRSVAAFLSECVGLHCLDVDIDSEEYLVATSRRNLVKKELRRAESKILELIRPFASIRGLAWANFFIDGRHPRDIQNSRAEFCDELDKMVGEMHSEGLVPPRTDLPDVKALFNIVFKLSFNDTRAYMKTRYGIDVNSLADKAWQACETGDRDEVSQQHKVLSQVWLNQKRIIEDSLEQIEVLVGDNARDK